jgi:hypothetical protein
MKKFNRAGKTFTTVVAGATVLAVFGTGSAVAGGLITSAKIKNNTVKSIDVRDNTLKGVDVRDGALTGADVADGSLTGSDVADGSLTGNDVADGSLSNQDVNVFFVTAEADGTVNASSGGVTVTKTGTGEYRADFNRPVGTCAFSATVGDPTSAVEFHGEADVIGQFLTTDQVHVFTRTAGTATAADLPFQLTAVC